MPRPLDDYDRCINSDRQSDWDAREAKSSRDIPVRRSLGWQVHSPDDAAERVVFAAGLTCAYHDDEDHPDYDTTAEREMDVQS